MKPIKPSITIDTRLDLDAAQPRPQNELGIRLGEHWTVVGRTGSGKTRFCVRLLEYLRRQYPHAKRYVLDSTGDGMPELHAARIITGDMPPDPLADSTYTQVWVPDNDDVDAYNHWLLKILSRREPAIILLDEIASLINYGRAGNALEGHLKVLKQGRKMGITVVNGTQEIARVPGGMFKQMSHFAQFRLNRDPYEWASARRYLDILKEEQHPPTSRYGFFYTRTDGSFPTTEYSSVTEFFKH